MTRTLIDSRRAAKSGSVSSAVVFLHGYGADGTDLLGLADTLAPHLPNTVFRAPDAPQRSTVNPFGYQWFPIPWMDGASEAEMHAGFQRSVADINLYLDRVLSEEGIDHSALVLFGFSQGTMMSLHVAPRRACSLAAVVGFSGRLLNPLILAEEVKSKPPVLLVHGDQDVVVPFASLSEASDSLVGLEFEVRTYVMKGVGHGISPDGLGVAQGFIRSKVGLGQ